MANASKLAAARRERLLKTMAEDGTEALLVFGNAWQGDYLRYGTDFAAVEGDALAVIVADGETRLFVESDAEAERAALACPDVKPTASSDIVGEARAYLKRLGNRRVRSAPGTLLPFGSGGRQGFAARRRHRHARPSADGEAAGGGRSHASRRRPRRPRI